MNHFTYAPEEYSRNTDIIPAYIEDCALFLSRMRRISLDEARTFIKQNMQPGGLAPLKDRDVLILQRDRRTGDRTKRTTTLTQYFDAVREHQLIMVPTMTVYLNPNQKKSYIAKYIARNLKKRKEYKAAMFQAKMAKDKAKEDYYNILQNSTKIKNNSVSGAHASPSTILYNKSSHSTLTSGCRIATSYANANNEWFLGGNRHYWCPAVVQAHLITTMRHSDLSLIEQAMRHFNLYYPTTVDVMDCIRYSSSLYWSGVETMLKLQALVDTMTPVERAAFVYGSDMHHLAVHNPEFVRSFLGRLSEPASTSLAFDEAKKVMKEIDDAQKDMVVLLCANVMSGRTLYGDGSVCETDPIAFGILGQTAKNLLESLNEYELLIKAFWRTSVLPHSIAVLPNIIRRVVMTSDTDSTIFTNQRWTSWFTNNDNFCEKAYQIGYTTTYLTSQLVKHKLALMSANLGVVTEQIHKIEMKNEYYFPVYNLTPSAKHYYALRSAQEGLILDKIETEIKGVHLRDSSAPPHVTKRLKEYMEFILHTTRTKGQLSIHEVFGPVAELEHSIIQDVKQGGLRYMKSAQIKDPVSYVQGDQAPPYQHYLFWEAVFAPKYGSVPPPPFSAVKVSVDLESPSKCREWIQNLADRELAGRIQAWLDQTGKNAFTTFVLPLPILQVTGIPPEIVEAINVRKLARTIVAPFYLVMESLGIYMTNDNACISRLVSDTYIPPTLAASAI